MLQNQTILENLYNDVEDIKKIANTESLIITLDRVLFLIDASKRAYEAEIEIAKLIGRNELLSEMLKKNRVLENDGSLDETTLYIRNLLQIKISDCTKNVRILNCMRSAEITTIADLVSREKSSLFQIRSLGSNSIETLENIVDRMGLNFGMKVDRYLLNENI
jgi:DNA-directed RNA polymerase subunit alpha